MSKCDNAILVCTKGAENLLELSKYEEVTIHFSKTSNTVEILTKKIVEEHTVLNLENTPVPKPDKKTRKMTRGRMLEIVPSKKKRTRKGGPRSKNVFNKLSAERIAFIYQSYQKGTSAKELAEPLGVSPHTIVNWSSTITRMLHNKTTACKQTRHHKDIVELLRNQSSETAVNM